jgi:hypothetical protein
VNKKQKPSGIAFPLPAEKKKKNVYKTANFISGSYFTVILFLHSGGRNNADRYKRK